MFQDTKVSRFLRSVSLVSRETSQSQCIVFSLFSFPKYYTALCTTAKLDMSQQVFLKEAICETAGVVTALVK